MMRAGRRVVGGRRSCCRGLALFAFLFPLLHVEHEDTLRHAHLRRRQADARSIVHGFLHVADQPLDLVSRYFISRERTRGLPQNRLSCLHNL